MEKNEERFFGGDAALVQVKASVYYNHHGCCHYRRAHAYHGGRCTKRLIDASDASGMCVGLVWIFLTMTA